MKIIRIFDLPSTKLFTVQYDSEDLDALEKLRLEWSSMEFLLDFFTKFQRDYFENYGNSNRPKLVRETIELADSLFEKLYQLAQYSDLGVMSRFFKPLDNREMRTEPYELQKLKAKGKERKSYLRIYAIRYRETIIITGGAIKLTDRMQDRPHTNEQLKRLELVKEFLNEGHSGIEFSYLDIE